MMMTAGQAVRRIRLDKHMALREAAGEAISVAQLSRFETDRQDLGINVLLQVLTNINSNITEMRHVQLAGESDIAVDRLVAQLKTQGKSPAGWAMAAQVDLQKYAHDPTRRLERLVAGALWIYLTESYGIQPAIPADSRRRLVAEAQGYLGRVETWGVTELSLYNLYSPTLADDDLFTLMKPALSRGKSYIGLYEYFKIVPFILNTNFSIFVSHNRLDLATATLRMTEDFLADEGSGIVAPRIFYIFNQGLLLFKQDQPAAGRQKCTEAIRVARIFDEDPVIDLLTKRLQKWENHYQEAGFTDILI